LATNVLHLTDDYFKQKKITEEIAAVRAQLLASKTPEQQAKANHELSIALKTILASSAKYPDLRSSSKFQELKEELSDIEAKVAAAREFYNTNVSDFNKSLVSGPSKWIANSFRFQAEPFFRSKDEK
jgi:LemA protein